MGKAADWLREERRKVLGDWASVCLECGAAQRWFEEFEADLPERCPACGGPTLLRCMACNAPSAPSSRSTAKRAARSFGRRSSSG
jgi:DNA-directed RNA polymerase subunit RPC12/RpoP